MEQSPYQAPESNVETPESFKRSVGWKVYFFLITAISLLGYTTFFMDPAAGMPEIVSFAIFVIATVGLFGFVFVKPILNPRFWLITFVIYLGFSIVYYFVTEIDLRAGMEDVEYYASSAFGWILSLPAIYALYAYSRPSDPAWTKR